MSKKWSCRSRQTFFGLTDDYMEDVYEQIFALMYGSNWDFQQAYNLPVQIRHWFVKRLVKQKEMESKKAEEARTGNNTQVLGG